MPAGRRLSRAIRRVLAGACALIVLASPAAAAARQGPSLEDAVKANYLVRFAAFASWPEQAFATPSAPVVVCIQGRDPFGAVLDRAVEGQAVNGRSFRVVRLEQVSARSGCHLVYLGGSGAQSTDAALSALRGAPVLTVTDTARGGGRGIVHFALSDNRVRFHVDDQLAAQGGLTISSRLLGLALSVRSRRPS